MLIYGQEKVGKSTFAAHAPSPIFLGADNGTDELDIARLPKPESFGDIIAGLNLVVRHHREKGWKTLVIDPLNWFETIVAHAVKPDGKLEGFEDHNAAGAFWRRILAAIERVWNAGLAIVIVAHSKVKSVELPDTPRFDRYEIAMGAASAGLFAQWVDAILFAKVDVFVTAPSKKGEKPKVASDGVRNLYTSGSAAFAAGNRYSLPPVIDLSWHAFEEARKGAAARLERVTAEIAQALDELGDDNVRARVSGYMADPTVSREEILNSLRTKISERNANAAAPDDEASSEQPEGETTTETENDEDK